MSKKEINLDSLKSKSANLVENAHKYSVIAFICVVVAVYGLVLFRLHVLRNTQPTPESISAQVKESKVPHIDEAVVQKLRSLHDNSVSVQSLFDSARSNPFKE